MDLPRAERIRADWKAVISENFGADLLGRCEVIIDGLVDRPTVTFVATTADYDPRMRTALMSVLEPFEWIRTLKHDGQGEADLMMLTSGQGSDDFIRDAYLSSAFEFAMEGPAVVDALNDEVLSRRPPLVREIDDVLRDIDRSEQLIVGPRIDGITVELSPILLVLGASDKKHALAIVERITERYPRFTLTMLARIDVLPIVEKLVKGKEWAVMFGRYVQ